MIERFRLQRFKSHADTTIELGRLTVLVGDNASGKTSVLQALAMSSQIASLSSLAIHPRHRLQRGAAQGIELQSAGTHQAMPWEMTVVMDPAGHGMTLAATWGEQQYHALIERAEDGTLALADPESQWPRSPAQSAVRDARLFRIDGEVVSRPVPANEPMRIRFDGWRTARVLAGLKLNDDGGFDAVMRAAQQVIPSLRSMRIEQYTDGGEIYERGAYYRLLLSFTGSDNILAREASQGTLTTLALLTILHAPERPRLLMLDDFDQALHPRAQMELVRILKRLLDDPQFADLQIVATTHSPYVLDELEPSDVVALALRADGTVASKRLSEHPDAIKSPGTFRTGELWTLDAERDWVLEG